MGISSSITVMKVGLIISLSFLISVQTKNSSNEYQKTEDDTNIFNSFRLLNETIPLKYDIFIETAIHIGQLEFNGSTGIEILIVQDTDKIVLHAKDLRIIQLTLQEFGNNNKIYDVEYAFIVDYHFLMVFSSKKSLSLKSGERYYLKIDYTAQIMDTYNVGFYKVPYKDSNGIERWLGATYFSRGFARSAFPCYDEPSFKANFSVSIAHGRNISAISNMDIKLQTSLNRDITLTSFYETPPMSTFLVTFVIGPLENSCEHYENVTQCIYSIPEQSHKGKSFLQIAEKLLTAMQEYFGISYKLSKLDHVALPVFQSNAMENWGIILYRDWKLLNYKTTSGGLFVENIITLSHELVHQWFGNLVTPKWYTWWWLSEGFATMYSFHALNLVYPEQGLLDIYMSWYHPFSYQRFYRPATKFINNKKDMHLIMNGVIYSGASSMLHMFSHAMGVSTFHKGIKNYLQKFQYSTTDENDLIDCLQKAAIEDNVNFFNTSNSVELLMKSWLHQEGYPILNVIRNYENNSFSIYQESELELNDENTTPPLWWIPINYATASKPNFPQTNPNYVISNYTIFDNESVISNNDWLILNKQQTGYYRVNYDEKNWNLIISSLHKNPTAIHHYNKAQLLHDTYYFAKQGKNSWLTFFNLLSYIRKEDNLVPWISLTALLNDMEYQLRGISNFKTYMRTLFEPLYLKYASNNNKNDTFFIKFASSKILEASCKLDMENCLEDLKKLILDNWEDIETVQPFTLCHGLKALTEDEFKIVYQRLKTYKHSNLLRNIACTRSEKNLNFLLENIVKPNENFTQDERRIILNTIYNEHAISVLTKFFSRNSFAFKSFDMTVEDIASRMINWMMVDEIGRIKIVNFVKEHLNETNSSLLSKIDTVFDEKVKGIKIFEKDFYKWRAEQENKTPNNQNKVQYHKILPNVIEKSILIRILKLAKILKLSKHFPNIENILKV